MPLPRKLIGFLIILALGLALVVWLRNSGPPPLLPADPEKLDPEVAALIEQAAGLVQRQPGSLELRQQLGMVYEANGLHALAAQTYRQALDQDHGQAETWFRHAICLEREGDLDQAIAAMEQAVKLAPDFVPARWRLANWLLDVGRVEEAVTRVDEALARDNGDPSAWLVKARTLLTQRENQQAIDLIRDRDLMSGENSGYAHFLVGTAYRQMGELEKAQPYLSAEDSTPNWRDAWSRRLQSYQTGDALRRSVASTMVRQQRYEEAMEPLQQILGRSPDDYRCWNLLGACYLRTGQLDQAVAAFESAVRADEGRFASHVNLVSAMMAAHRSQAVDLDKALRHAELTVSLQPNQAKAYLIRAAVQAARGSKEEALQDYTRAFALDAREPTAAIEAGYLEIKLNRVAAAEDRFAELLSSGKQQQDVLAGMALVKLLQNDVATAHRLLEEAERGGVDPHGRIQRVRQLLRVRTTREEPAGDAP